MPGERMTVEEELKNGEGDEEGDRSNMGEDEGADDGASDKADEKAGEAEPDAAGETGVDAGTEGEEAGEDSGGDDEEGAEEPDGAAPSVSALTALVGQLNAKIEAMQKAPPAAQASQPWTPERWAKLEEDTGLKEPAVKFLFGEMIKPLMDNITGKYEGRLARIERDYVINDLAGKKGFEDIRAHMDGINEFLKNFDPAQASDPDVIKMGLVYARGLKAKESVRKAGNTREVGKRIAGLGKKTNGGPSGKGGHLVKLNPMEKQAAKLGNMSEQEYWNEKYGKKGRK